VPSTDDSLRIYAVNIVQDPRQSWTGYGIYLGKGLLITAAHVVGQASHTMPSVRPDLTLLLSIDEQKLPVSLGMRCMPLCDKPAYRSWLAA
jgi:hypothetical protein